MGQVFHKNTFNLISKLKCENICDKEIFFWTVWETGLNQCDQIGGFFESFWRHLITNEAQIFGYFGKHHFKIKKTAVAFLGNI